MPDITLKSLLGQPVITRDTGRRVGSIQEVMIDTVSHSVTAIVLTKPPVARPSKVVVADHVCLLGVDVTLIDTEGSIGPLPDPAPGALVRPGTEIIRTQVLSTEGSRLGEVSDIALTRDGRVTAFRLSHSLIRDTFRRRPYIRLDQLFAVGLDAILADLGGAEEADPAPAAVVPDEPIEAEDNAPLPLDALEDEPDDAVDEDEPADAASY